MKPRHFLNQLDDEKVVAAIRDAESKTAGEIRVMVSHKKVDNPILAAQRHFTRLMMDQTRDRNGVLIFVAPASCKFAIIGDVGVHTHCGDDFWTTVAAEMTEHFKQAQWTDGVVHAIQKAGALLAEHFPRQAGDKNQLSDQVEHD